MQKKRTNVVFHTSKSIQNVIDDIQKKVALTISLIFIHDSALKGNEEEDSGSNQTCDSIRKKKCFVSFYSRYLRLLLPGVLTSSS